MNKLFAISYTLFSLCFPSTLHAVDDILSSFVIKEPTEGKSIEIDIPLKSNETKIRNQQIKDLNLSRLLDGEIKQPSDENIQPKSLSLDNEDPVDSSLFINTEQTTRSTSNSMENIVEATKEIQQILKRMIPQNENLTTTKIISHEEARTAAILLRSSYLFVLEGIQFCALNKNLTTSQNAEEAIDSFLSRNSETLAKIPNIFDQTSELTSIEKETTRVFVRDFIQNYFTTNKHCSTHYDDIVTASVDLKRNNKTNIYTQTITQFLKQQNHVKEDVQEK